ncbi:tetratricopeptide repeat protein [Spirillospora sp. CA-255316]
MRRRKSSGEAALEGAIRDIERGKPERAWKPLRRCLESAQPTVSARAGALLIDLLLAQQDVDEAQRIAGGVLDRLGRETGPEAHEGTMQAIIAQAMVFQAKGDRERARDRFRTVMAEGPPDLAGLAAFNLGTLLPDLGDLEGAREALQAAVDSGEPKLVPRAAVNLGILLASSGGWAGARAAFETAAAGSDPVQAALGRFHLLLMRERHLPPGRFGTPFDEDLESLEALEAGSEEWHRARKRRLGTLQLQGSRMILASMRRQDDRTRQLELYVGLLEIGARPGTQVVRARLRAIGRVLRGAAHSVMGPYNAGRCRRKLAEVERAAGAEPAALTPLLEEAATWSALARERGNWPALVPLVTMTCGLSLRWVWRWFRQRCRMGVAPAEGAPELSICWRFTRPPWPPRPEKGRGPDAIIAVWTDHVGKHWAAWA